MTEKLQVRCRGALDVNLAQKMGKMKRKRGEKGQHAGDILPKIQKRKKCF